MTEPLPVHRAPVPERADAARNRRRIFAVAERLFAEHGAENVSMDAIARAAGVGKGTLYRRFGDRGGLAHAVCEENERALQDQLIRGAPPLGPGACAQARLHAFGHAYLDLLDGSAPLLALARTDLAVDRGPYGFYHLHVRLLLEQAAPRSDADLLAHALLSTLGAPMFLALRDACGIPLERRKAVWDELVAGCCGG